MEQAPAMEAPAPAMEGASNGNGNEAQDVPAVETAEPEMTVEQAPTKPRNQRRGRDPPCKKEGWLGQSRTA